MVEKLNNPFTPKKMKQMKSKTILSILFMVTLSMGTFAQKGYNYAEIKKKKAVTPEALTDSIVNYVNENSNKKGYFLVNDPVQKKDLDLKLIDVHKDCYADMGGNIYFVCGNFRGTDGKIYDVDFFFKKEDGKMKNTLTKVHKVNFVARYNWYLVDGKWVTKPVKDKKSANKENDRPHR